MKRNMLISLCLAASICMFGLFTGCGNQSPQKAIITTVVNELYTCPNETFSKAYANESSIDPNNGTAETTALTEENSPTIKYISDTYRQYFSDSAYASFLSKMYVLKYQLPSIEEKWSSKVTKISLKSEGNAKYSFTCDIDVTDNSNNTAKQQITGSIEFDESGKIRWFNEYKTFLAE